ncbi:MAG: BCD family MFS transporter [Caldilineales bacterium]|nr:BCD family MFS transporter [Caldilineales bacterium]
MTAAQANTETTAQPKFSVLRSMKLGSFHIGSSLTDLLITAVANRLLIVELGVAAWPIGLLTALRYFLSPLSLWVGYRSDRHPIFGSRRIAYIWIGRLLMLVALPLIPLALAALGFDTASAMGWLMLLASSLLYGVGTLISGAPYLALVHDSAPYERRGQVIAIVQTFLVASFAFGGFLYGRLLPVWSYQDFWRLVLFSMAGAAVFWFFSVWHEERNLPKAEEDSAERPSFTHTFTHIVGDDRMRRYAIFLGAAAFFAFMYDLVLEPFGGDVFGMAVGETTRFNAYWGTGVLIAMIATAYLTRRWRPEQQVGTTVWGLALLAIPTLFLALISYLQMESAIRPVLFAFGIGFGIYTIGGVALLMAMNDERQAATYLALWSTIQLVFRGLGIAAGGVLRDVALALTGQFSSAYALVFLVEGLGLLVCIFLLMRVGVASFAAQSRSPATSDLLAATVD